MIPVTYKILRIVLLVLAIGLIIGAAAVSGTSESLPCCLGGFAMAAMVLRQAIRNRALCERCTAHTVGRITDTKRVHTRRSYYHVPIVEYEQDGVFHRFRGNSRCEKTDVGGSIDVFYDPQDPTFACTEHPSTMPSYLILCGLTLFGLLSLLWHFL